MYKDLSRTCLAIVLFIEPFGHVQVAVAAPYYVRTYKSLLLTK